jgi:hypothetical protein
LTIQQLISLIPAVIGFMKNMNQKKLTNKNIQKKMRVRQNDA